MNDNQNSTEKPVTEIPQSQPLVTNLLEKLQMPFSNDVVSLRVQKVTPGNNNYPPQALLVAYLQARDVMNRLDEVFPLAWEDDYVPICMSSQSIVQGYECTLTVTLPDGRKISRKDVGEVTQMEALKGGYSDALKRAAVKFGIGRYLYELPVIRVPVYQQRDKSKASWDEWEYVNSNNVKGYYLKPKIDDLLKKQAPQTRNQQDKIMNAYSANNSQQHENRKQANNSTRSSNGHSPQEYEQAVMHVTNIFKDLNIPLNDAANLSRSVLKVQLLDSVALNQMPFEILKQLHNLLSPVKVLFTSARSFGLDQVGVYQFASTYLQRSVTSLSDLFGIDHDQVKSILENIKQYFANNKPRQNRA